MAFVKSPLPQEEQNQLAPTGQTTPNPAQPPPPNVQTGGSAGQGGGSGGPGGTPGVGSPTQFGSSASKLGDYLTANADQVQGMANQVAGQIGGQYNTAKGGIDQAAQQFGSQVQGGYTPLDPTLIGQVKSNPVEAASKPENVSAFQKQFNSQYTGPTSFEGSDLYGGASQKASSAVQQAGLLGSYSGLSGYLQNNIETNATPGQNTLDTVLLQGNQPAYQTVQNAAKPFTGLQDYLTNISGQQNQGIQQAQQSAANTRQAAQQAIKDVSNPLVEQLNTGYQKGFQGAQDYNTGLNTIAGKIANNNFSGLTGAEQNQVGFNPALLPLMQQYPNIFPTQAQANPISWSNYFTQGDQAKVPTPANTVTPDQLAQFNAISSLSGSSPEGVNFTMPQQLEGSAGVGGKLPQYGNLEAGQAISSAYEPMYASLQPGQRPDIDSYMNSLRSMLGQNQPAPQPTTPQPPSGTGGDLGAGFTWDPTTGTWQPNIPLQPKNPIQQPPPGTGGGHAFR